MAARPVSCIRPHSPCERYNAPDLQTTQAPGVNRDTYANPSILIETDELEARLGEDNLRIIDCDVLLTPRPQGGYDVSSGWSNWLEAHVPGSIYVDIDQELSAEHPRLRFMLPPAEQFARVMSRSGIGNDHRVVVYSRGGNYWATRLYLMFREFGFENVAVLNGAWDRWIAEGRPITTDAPAWPETHFVAGEPRRGFVGKDRVLAAIDDADTCIMNALSPAIHTGETFNPPYGRPGRIKGSVNLYALELIDPDSNRFLEPQALAAKLAASGALDAECVITYCGGGISATTNAFALRLLGKEDVVVYDGSLSEWGNDASLPMERGPPDEIGAA